MFGDSLYRVGTRVADIQTGMGILDIAIIYLACGAPFAVSVLVKNRLTFDIRVGLTALRSFVGWPVIGFLMARRRVMDRFGWPTPFWVSDANDILIATTRLAHTLENDWHILIGESTLKRFREAAERYIAISVAIREARSTKAGGNELLEIIKHPDVEAGAACFNRQNLKKLLFHQTGARTDFVDVVGELVEAGSTRTAAIVAKIAELLGDDEAVTEIAFLADSKKDVVVACRAA